jgi:hypothetical protein
MDSSFGSYQWNKGKWKNKEDKKLVEVKHGTDGSQLPRWFPVERNQCHYDGSKFGSAMETRVNGKQKTKLGEGGRETWQLGSQCCVSRSNGCTVS